MATLNVKDALSYLDQVKVQFAEHPDVYNRFLDIMKDFKSQTIDTPGVIERVSTLFRGHPSLIQGFNTFLPPGYRIECSLDPSESNLITVTTPTGTTTQTSGGVGIAGAISRMQHGGTGSASGAPAASVGAAGAASASASAHRERSTPAPSGAAPPPPHTPGGSSYTNNAGAAGAHAPALPPGTMASLGTPQRQPHSPALGGPATPGATAGAGVLSHASFGSSGLPGGATSQQGGDRRAPVEFNHAISYVNRIKQRFSNDPDTYKQFLEILQTYQKEQRPIGDVYAQVTTLFNNDKDLLDEFKQFLPDTSAGAPPSGGNLFGMLGHASTNATQPGVAAPSGAGMGPGHGAPQLHGMHGMMQGVPPNGGGAPGRHEAGALQEMGKKAGSGSRSKKRAGGGAAASGPGATTSEHGATGRGSKSKKSKHGHVGPKHEGHSPPRDMLPPDAAAAAAYNNAHLMHHQPPPGALIYGVDGSLVPAAGLGAGMGMGADASLISVGPGANAVAYGLGAGAVTAPLATTDEVTFFDRVKKLIDDRTVYLEFLKLLNLYTQDIIDVRTLVDRASLFIGGDRELFEAFQRLCGYDMGKHGWLEAEDPIIENVPALQRERVDLSSCKVYGASYRKLPKSEINLACSGRDPMCWEVLNDVWVSHPTWASEGESFNPHKKNVYEDALYRSEEERHEYDYHIEANLRTIALLEPIAARVQTMDADERAAFRLKPGLGGQSKSIYQRVIKKVYGREHGVEVIAALHDNPCVAVPVVLARLKQKDEEWKRAQREWNKVWREVDARNYYKSLDHQGVNFKVSDKKTITSKAFVAEIESRRAQQQQRRLTIDATLPRPRPDHQLAFAMDDMVVLTDIVKLSLSFLDRAPYSKSDCDRIEHLLRTFIPLLLCLDQTAFDDDINGGVAVNGRDAVGAEDDADSRADDDARSEASDADSSVANGASSNTKRSGSSKRQEADLRRTLLRNQAETSGAAQTGWEAEATAARASSPAIAAEVKAAADALDLATAPMVAGNEAVKQPQDVSMVDDSDTPAKAGDHPPLPSAGDAAKAGDTGGDVISTTKPEDVSTWIDQNSLQAYDSSKARRVPVPGSAQDAAANAAGAELPPPRKYNFFCSTSHYVFIRLFQLLYARLSRMKQLGEQMASAEPRKKRLNPVALELGLQDPATGPASVVGTAAASAAINRGSDTSAPATNGNGGGSEGPNGVSVVVEENGLSLSPLRYYDTLLDLTEKFFDAELDRVTFEESVRYMYGIDGYVVFTLDKVIGSLVKTAQVIATDAKCQELQSILEADRALGAAAGMKAQIARRLAAEAVLGKDEHLFRLEWVKASNTLLVQMLAKEDLTLGDPHTAEQRWLQYVSSYVLYAPTEGLSIRVEPPFLRRSIGDSPEEKQELPGTTLIAQSGLGIKICINTLRLFYDDRGYEDVFARRLLKTQIDRREKATQKQRDARKARLSSWISTRLAAISADGEGSPAKDTGGAEGQASLNIGMDVDPSIAPRKNVEPEASASGAAESSTS